jgi:tripeptide aminopeptidase
MENRRNAAQEPLCADAETLATLFCELVALDNESFDEREMADAVTRRLQAMGLTVAEDDTGTHIGASAGNLYAVLPGTGHLRDAAPIALCAHMDSVSPARGKRAVRHADGSMTSAGDTVLGADDLSAVAAILEAVRILKASSMAHRPLELLFTVCEEPYTLGSRTMAQRQLPLRAKTVIVPDLTGRVGTAAIAAPTILALTVTVIGRASHAGFAPEAGIHAIAVAARALSRLKLGHVDADTTVGIGTISGGTVANAVPEKCVLCGEIRGYADARVWEELQTIKDAFEQEASDAGAAVQIETELRTKAYRMAEDAFPVALFTHACCQRGIACTLTQTFGGSDANTFAEQGLDVLVIASAMENVHSVNERTELCEMTRLCELLLSMACCDDVELYDDKR